MPIKKRRCRRCGKNRQLRFYSPRGRICATCRKGAQRAASRDARLRRTYGITQAEYDALLEAQGGGCAICGGTRRYNLHVDHSHARERVMGSRASVRGLLCARDNKLLAKAMDDPETLEAAAAYLRNPPARKVIH